MLEKFPYNLEKAQDEAAKMQVKVESGEAKDYAEAEALFTKDEESKKLQKETIKQLNKECNDFSREISKFAFNEETIDVQIIKHVKDFIRSNFDINVFYHPECADWEIILNEQGNVKTIVDADREVSNFLRTHKESDAKYRNKLYRTWRNKMNELISTLYGFILEKQDTVREAAHGYFERQQQEKGLEKYIEYLQNILDKVKFLESLFLKVKDDGSDRNKVIIYQLSRIVSDVAIHNLAETKPVHEEKKAQMIKHEKEEGLRIEQEEALLAQIEQQTGYLCELYGAGTGLDLIEVRSAASREQGNTVGSVSVGLGLAQRVELKNTLSLELIAEDSLTLEMGNDLDSMKKRMAMVNWIAPHEIAHLVELASDMSKRIFGEEGMSSSVRSLIENWRGDNQNLAREMIPLVMEETTIDAIGYRMVKEYGTANPLEEAKAERITAAMRGYVVAMDVIDYILKNSTEENEMKARYSVVLLREIAVGEVVLEEAKNNKINREDVDNLKREIKKLRRTFDGFNRKTHFVESAQVQEIVTLCKDYFRKAEVVPLVREMTEK